MRQEIRLKCVAAIGMKKKKAKLTKKRIKFSEGEKEVEEDEEMGQVNDFCDSSVLYK